MIRYWINETRNIVLHWLSGGIRVQGRAADVLYFIAENGEQVSVITLPLRIIILGTVTALTGNDWQINNIFLAI